MKPPRTQQRKQGPPAEGGGRALRKKQKNISTQGYIVVLWVTIILLLLVFAASLSLGRYRIPLPDSFRIVMGQMFPLSPTWDTLSEAVILTLRLPRTVAAIIIGAALAQAGGCYQSIFKNPMVSPDLLGVSSGACVGAAAAILFGWGSLMIQVGAFVLGVVTVGITTLIPRLIRNQSTTVLVLSGVVVGSLMASILNIIKSVADTDTQLAEITYWTMGSFASIQLPDMVPVLPTIFIPMAVILLMRYRLNVLSLGDNEARTLGINLRTTRGIFILCATLLTASCVCLSGTIGWVGLVIPHTARMIVGADNKRMMPVAMLFGSVFMLVIDILCRTLTAAELRIGILTGIVGAPFFIFLLIKQHRSLQ